MKWIGRQSENPTAPAYGGGSRDVALTIEHRTRMGRLHKSITWERWHPYVAAVMATAAWLAFQVSITPQAAFWASTLTLLLGLSSFVVAFAVTRMLDADTPLAAEVAKTRYAPIAKRYISETMVSVTVLLSVSAWAAFHDHKVPETIWIGMSAFTLAATWRLSKIAWRIRRSNVSSN